MSAFGGWRGLLGRLFASGLIGVQVGLILSDQLAQAWPWGRSVGVQALVVGGVWLLIFCWCVREPKPPLS